MRRIALATLLAALGLVGTAAATDGPAFYGYKGCRGWGFHIFPSIHQHGPLFNYGPYYGYPPFEPYGYWNSYLQYTGPVPPPDYASGHPGAYGWIHGPNPRTFGSGNPHPLLGGGGGGGGGGIFHRGGKGASGGCSSCGAAAERVVNSGNALERYTGVGRPSDSQAYYAESTAPSIVPVQFPGK
ncbi:MAG TPA: hypothetical protein VN641_18440 [Urbifossiella sp.]|jgi:hypothetical protein|nr:hypothetical protein [Urbifossiella sp.]